MFFRSQRKKYMYLKPFNCRSEIHGVLLENLLKREEKRRTCNNKITEFHTLL